jgi:hypothetical protein
MWLEEVSSEELGDENSDSDDSNFITSSDNSEHVKQKVKVDDLGLPSEDSEDYDYDPAGPDSDKDIQKKQDESYFTSDSDISVLRLLSLVVRMKFRQFLRLEIVVMT